MSKHIDYSYPRGSKNPDSRNPAAGGGVRSSQQPQIQHSKNPNNLFGKLLKVGNSMRFEHSLLINFLKSYTKGVSPYIAENPRSEDINKGIGEMIKEISPGAVMFKNICEHGLSPITIGEPMFEKIMKMKCPPQNGHIWALPKCPKIRNLQKTLFFERPRGIPNHNYRRGEVHEYKNVGCFVAGVCFHPDGTTGFFTQEPSKGGVKPDYEPDFMKDLPAIIWSTSIGSLIPVFHIDYVRLQNEMDEHSNGAGTAWYCSAGTADMDDFVSKTMMEMMIENGQRDDQEKTLFTRKYPTKKEQLPYDDAFLRSNPEYKRLADEAMAKINGIPISLYSKIEHEEAERAEDSGQCAEDAESLSWGAAAGL
jgi:hypothetical protein